MYHCPEVHMEEIAWCVREEYDGKEQEPDVWQYQEAQKEVSSRDGSRMAIEEGRAAEVVGSETQATATRSRPGQSTSGGTDSPPSESEGAQTSEGRHPARRTVPVAEKSERQEQPTPTSSIDDIKTAKPTDTVAVMQPGGGRTELAVRLGVNSAEKTLSEVSDQTRNGGRSRKRRRNPSNQADDSSVAEGLHSVHVAEALEQASQQVTSRGDTPAVEEENFKKWQAKEACS
ncbi:unnamed protein product [Phytophthora fragariaefolia]|uniref:Unnamed protein product n=1 Tax=Phytophthora fragariaefolia TaxID=1490495 RepID=A0A9W6XIG2_9STRA|nr:unnamed protein product [Phytophthora fragariaefolia]